MHRVHRVAARGCIITNDKRRVSGGQYTQVDTLPGQVVSFVDLTALYEVINRVHCQRKTDDRITPVGIGDGIVVEIRHGESIEMLVAITLAFADGCAVLRARNGREDCQRAHDRFCGLIDRISLLGGCCRHNSFADDGQNSIFSREDTFGCEGIGHF